MTYQDGINRCATYLDQMPLLLFGQGTHTHTHVGAVALPGPLKLSAMKELLGKHVAA